MTNSAHNRGGSTLEWIADTDEQNDRHQVHHVTQEHHVARARSSSDQSSGRRWFSQLLDIPALSHAVGKAKVAAKDLKTNGISALFSGLLQVLGGGRGGTADVRQAVVLGQQQSLEGTHVPHTVQQMHQSALKRETAAQSSNGDSALQTDSAADTPLGDRVGKLLSFKQVSELSKQQSIELARMEGTTSDAQQASSSSLVRLP